MYPLRAGILEERNYVNSSLHSAVNFTLSNRDAAGIFTPGLSLGMSGPTQQGVTNK